MKTLMAVRLLQQKVITVQGFYTRLAEMSGLVDTAPEEEKTVVVYLDKEATEEQLPQEEYITEETIEMEEAIIHEEVLEVDTLDPGVQFIHEDIQGPSEVQVNPHNAICLVVCSFCDDKFLNHNLLMVHKLQQHKEESVHQRSQVVVVYKEQSQDGEDEEEWKTTEEEPGTTKRHQKERDLSKSLSQFKVNKDYVCEHCGDVHPNLVSLKRHRRKTHEAPKQRERCTICGRFYMDLKVHYKMMHGKPKEVCPVCGVETLRLKWHMLVHEERRHKCEICDNSFRTHYDVERHMRVHTGERVRCLFCPHMASHQDNSKTHMLKKHPEEYRNMLLEKRGLKGVEFADAKEEEMMTEEVAGEWAEVQSE